MHGVPIDRTLLIPIESVTTDSIDPETRFLPSVSEDDDIITPASPIIHLTIPNAENKISQSIKQDFLSPKSPNPGITIGTSRLPPIQSPMSRIASRGCQPIPSIQQPVPLQSTSAFSLPPALITPQLPPTRSSSSSKSTNTQKIPPPNRSTQILHQIPANQFPIISQKAIPPRTNRIEIPPPASRIELLQPTSRSELPPPASRSELPTSQSKLPMNNSKLPTRIELPANRTELPPPASRSQLPPPASRSELPPPASRSELPPPASRPNYHQQYVVSRTTK